REAHNLSDLSGIIPILDGIFGPGVVTNATIDIDILTDQFTQEFRLTSLTKGPLQWTVGMFYKDSSEFLGVDGDSTPPVSDLTGGFYSTLLLRDLDDDFQQIAVFGEASYEVTDNLKATLGLRWFNETRESLVTVGGPFFGSDAPITSPTAKSDTSEVNPKFALSYDMGETMFYFTAAKGFRSGGANGFPAPPPLDSDSYEPDTLWGYELGTKSLFLDGNMIFKGALFYSKWENVQTKVPSTIPGFEAIINGGDAHVQGIELELTALLSDNFQADLSGSWLGESEYDDDSTGSAAGDPLVGVAENNLNAAITHHYDITNDYSLISNLNYNMVGESYVVVGVPGVTPAYEILNMSVSLQALDWSVTLFATNLLDEFILYRNDGPYGDPTYEGAGLSGPPRTIGVRFGLDF
ncbi:MAG: hypothetical protein DRQ47_06490, partial [Gammaproteobacteria bacterium]